MRRKFLPYLIDPVSSKPLALLSFEEEDGQVISGILQSNKGSWYPIINGIPRILTKLLKSNLLREHYDFYNLYKRQMPANIRIEWQKEIKKIEDFDKFLKHQKRTAESFTYEWKQIYRESNFEKSNFLHFIGPFLKKGDLKNKKVIDIGCGSGRFTKWAALFGADIAFGTDLGESVEVAYKLTKNLENVCIVQADIYSMPFNKSFDIAYSIGVLHHLPKPKEGFVRLKKVIKKGGRMLIWVYNRRNNRRALYLYEPMRAITRKIPKPILLWVCYIPAFVVHLINYITRLMNLIGAQKIATKIPFYYYANFPFNMKLNDTFDVLSTPKSNYYFVEEIENWFKDAKFKNIKAYEHREAGITCVGDYE